MQSEFQHERQHTAVESVDGVEGQSQGESEHQTNSPVVLTSEAETLSAHEGTHK